MMPDDDVTTEEMVEWERRATRQPTVLRLVRALREARNVNSKLMEALSKAVADASTAVNPSARMPNYEQALAAINRGTMTKNDAPPTKVELKRWLREARGTIVEQEAFVRLREARGTIVEQEAFVLAMLARITALEADNAALEADKRRLVGHLNIISRGRGACEQQLCADAADMGLAAGDDGGTVMREGPETERRLKGHANEVAGDGKLAEEIAHEVNWLKITSKLGELDAAEKAMTPGQLYGHGYRLSVRSDIAMNVEHIDELGRKSTPGRGFYGPYQTVEFAREEDSKGHALLRNHARALIAVARAAQRLYRAERTQHTCNGIQGQHARSCPACELFVTLARLEAE